MLGSRADAEDVLQDAYLRFAGADRDAIRNEEAFLTTTVTRLCLDGLKSARTKREVYVGPWLPEPVLDAEDLTPETAAELAGDLSFALMLTLEKLSAPERAAFLLHDVFDTPFAQIAETLGKSEAACRQLAARARKAVKGARPGRRAAPEKHAALLTSFAAAIGSGDVGGLISLLAADALAVSDGGGVKAAALNPIYGAGKVVRFLTGIAHKNAARGRLMALEPAEINGEPGLLLYIDSALDAVLTAEVADGRISAVYIVRNPEKLGAFAGALH